MRYGTVILAGGGETPPEIPQTLAQFSAGEPLVVLAHTQQAVAEGAARSAPFLQQHGVETVYAPGTTDPEILVPMLARARAVWIPGGDQNRLMQQLTEPVLRAIRTVYERGGIVGGTSAGASLMGEFMPTGQQADQTSLTSGGCTLAPALGILPQVVVDQHFLRRKRLLRLLCALLENPHLTGIGVDEASWALIHDGTLTVKAGQVVVAQVQGKVKRHAGLLGTDSIRLQVLLPGDRWKLPH